MTITLTRYSDIASRQVWEIPTLSINVIWEFGADDAAVLREGGNLWEVEDEEERNRHAGRSS